MTKHDGRPGTEVRGRRSGVGSRRALIRLVRGTGFRLKKRTGNAFAYSLVFGKQSGNPKGRENGKAKIRYQAAVGPTHDQPHRGHPQAQETVPGVLKAMPEWDLKLTLADLRREDCTALLIPDLGTLDHAREYVESMYAALFEFELDSWFLDRSTWPKPRTIGMFREWFDVELHSMVIDVPGTPIRREAL